MTMQVDKGLLEAGFGAVEMGIDKFRQMHARKYSDKFAAFSSFEANTINLMLAAVDDDGGEVNCGAIKQGIGELWTHLVVGDGRWETHASFIITVTNTVLKVTSTTGKIKSNAAEELALWCLKGDGGEGEGEGYRGLLSLMAHGDPKSAKDRRVESLSLSLSYW